MEGMKVMILNAPVRLLRELSAVGGLELTVLSAPCDLSTLDHETIGARREAYQPRSKLDPRAILQVRRLVKEVRPDLIHAFHPKPLANALLATIGLKPSPKIVSFRGISRVPSRLDPGDLVTYLHPRVAAHACESDAVRQAMIAGGVPSERCFTTYHCIRDRTYARPGREGLLPWGIPPEAFVVGTVANIRPVKGIDILLRAALECIDLADMYWLLIGSVADRRVVRLAEDRRLRDRVRLLGFRSDAPDLISGADLFVMPSRQEALCVALLEAMHQQVCPIVSDAGGMKEVVRDGQDGLVVAKQNVDALAQAIRALYHDRDRLRRLAHSAGQRVADFCSPAQMARRTVQLYRRLAT